MSINERDKTTGGTYIGGVRASITNKERFGEDFYRRIGAKGAASRTKPGGFAASTIGKDGLTGSERARIAGARGGRTSRRTKAEKSREIGQ